MEEKEGVVTFEIPLGPDRVIRIELLARKEEEQIVEGRYTVSPMTNKETVIFQIQDAGKLLARPTGSLARNVWMLTSKK